MLLPTYRVYGHALEFEPEELGGSAFAARKGWIAISPCLCVQDAPQYPCQCGDMVWWLSKDAIIGHNKSGRKDQHGNDLEIFDVLVDSTIMVESLQPVKVGALKELGPNVTARSVRNLGLGTDGGFIPPGSGTAAFWEPFEGGGQLLRQQRAVDRQAGR